MNYFIIAFAITIIAAMILYGILSYDKGERRGYYISASFFMSAISFLLFAVAAIVSGYRAKVTLYSLAVVLGDLMFYGLFLFAGEVCNIKIRKVTNGILGLLLLADCLLFVSNPFTDFVEYVTEERFGFNLLVASATPVYIYHGLLRLGIIVLIGIIVLVALRRASVYYRMQYYVALAFIILIPALALFTSERGSGILDLSVILTMIFEIVLYHATFSFSPAILLKKLQGYINDSIEEATAVYDNTDNLLSINRIARNILPENAWKKANLLLDYLGNPKPEEEFIYRNGEKQYSVIYRPVMDSKNKHVAKTFIFHDVTEIEARIATEQRTARHDSLTGAYNRFGFFEAAESFLSENGDDTCFALLVSGIFGFKNINASYGTKAGDEVLKTIERTFNEYHHNYPLIYGRTAEGKFSVLLPVDYVEEIASDMSCITVNTSEGVLIHVDMFHGYAVINDLSKDVEYYYERALLALTECKKKANVAVLEYSYSMEDKIARQQEMLAEMHNAIRDEQFFIELQPQIDLEERKVVGAEALVRWNHPKLGRVMPGEFIPLFEENGFIINVDVFTWELAARTLKKFTTEGSYDGSVSINVSRIDLKNMDVLAVLERIVKQFDIDKKRFHVEITESACEDSRVKLADTMNQLRDAGFVIEIDDFGSGYSSLNALMKLPFDVIKLDMEFMKENNLDGKNGIIMNAISNMIHDLGAKIIVEGVETEVNVENMVRFEGDVAQGYYFSRPLPVDKFMSYVQGH